LVLVLWGGFGRVFRPYGAPQGVGLTRSLHFFLTVFFDALNDGENLSQPRFDLLDFGSDTALGNSLNIPFCSFDS
jgi:hypothetical protein